MSNATAANATPNNKEKAVQRIQSVVGRYKIIKLPVLVNDVIKNVFGDLKDAPDEKANKAVNLVNTLLNEMVENGEILQFNFVRMVREVNTNDRPSIINETIIVEGGFTLAGYVPAKMDESHDNVEAEYQQDGEMFSEDDEDEDEQLNELIRNNSAGYAVVNYKTGKETKREICIKHDIEAALGKHLSLASEEENSPQVYALIPVEIEIKSVLGRTVEVAESEEEEEFQN